MSSIHFDANLTIIWTSTLTSTWPRTKTWTGELEQLAGSLFCCAFLATAARHKVLLLLQFWEGVNGERAAAPWQLPKLCQPGCPEGPCAGVLLCLQPRGWEKLLIQIHTPCSACPTSCGNYHLLRVGSCGHPLSYFGQPGPVLNGLSRRFLLAQFDWSGLRGTYTCISANTSWEGINSWEKAMTSSCDYQLLYCHS